MHPRVTFLALTLAALVACGTSEKNDGDTAQTAAPAQHSLMIMAQEFSFDAPDTVPAGFTKVSLMNHGAEPHHAVIVRLDSGHVAGELLDALAKNRIPAWSVFLGGPNASMQGISETAVELKPGNHVVICLIPSADGVMHVAKGMVRQLTVKDAGAATVAPTADLTITLQDYSFTTSAPLSPGPHVIRVDNAAQQPHELVIVKLEPGKTIQEFAKWAEKPVGPPPGAAIGGTTPQASGIPNYVMASFEPGEYGFVCFVPDVKDGKLHLEHGMIQQ
ncbi:MAG: hypothetical protein ACT4P6_08515, partial [Gemmatimonadaceae bacterium]